MKNWLPVGFILLIFGAIWWVATLPPKPVRLLEVTFEDSNLFGIDVPLLKKEEKGPFLSFARPTRTGVLGGTRWTLITIDGDLVELKGSYDFSVKQLEWVEYTDPRHPKYEGREVE